MYLQYLIKKHISRQITGATWKVLNWIPQNENCLIGLILKTTLSLKTEIILTPGKEAIMLPEKLEINSLVIALVVPIPNYPEKLFIRMK
jgi:hypothetical protein